MSDKCFVCQCKLQDEDGQYLGVEVNNKLFCYEHEPLEFSNFPKDRYYPIREVAHIGVMLVAENDEHIYILLRSDGTDHPDMITLNKVNHTFDLEGYD